MYRCLPTLFFLLALVLPGRAFADGPRRVKPREVTFWVAPSSPPVARIRCSFDNIATGAHQEVEWESGRSTPRIVHIPVPKQRMKTPLKDWKISVWSDSLYFTAGNSMRLITATLKAQPLEGARQLEVKFRDSLDTKPENSNADAGVVQELTINIERAEPSAQRALPNSPTPSPLGARALDPVSGVAAELASVLAEIAVERAKAQSLALLTEQLKTALCDHLVWTSQIRSALQVPQEPATADHQPLFRRTCDAFSHLRMHELAATAKAVYAELIADLTNIAVQSLGRTLGRTLLEKVAGSKGAAVLSDIPALLGAITELQALSNALAAQPPDFAAVAPPLGKLVTYLGRLAPSVVNCPPGKDCAAVTKALVALGNKLAGAHGPEDVKDEATTALNAMVQDLALSRETKEALEALKEALGDWKNAPGTLRAVLARLPLDVDVGELEPLLKDIQRQGFSFAVLDLHRRELAKLLTTLKLPLDPAFERTLRELAAFEPFLRRVAELLVSARTGGTSLDRAGQLLLSELANEAWADRLCPATAPEDEPACVWACGAEAGFAVLRLCAERSAGCTAAEVGTILRTLDQDFEEGPCGTILEQLEQRWPGVDQLVLDGLEIVRPRPDATPRSTARIASRVFFTLAERRHCAGPASPGWCADLHDGREVAEGVLNEHTSQALVAGAKIVTRAIEHEVDKDGSKTKDHRRALLKITRVLGAFTAYAATYDVDAKGDAGKLKEQHEARKKAIEGLIDASTDRSGRQHEWVVSLGVNAGLMGGGQFAQDSTHNAGLPPQLVLPMGIAFQYLPGEPPAVRRASNQGKKESGIGCGAHLQFSPIDLGQFVAYTPAGTVAKPTWGNFLVVSGQFGLLIGKPTSAVGVGLDLRYAPMLFAEDATGTKAGAFRLGGYLSYYVPFFDFN